MRATPGIEPGTSRTRSENHTTRPRGHSDASNSTLTHARTHQTHTTHTHRPHKQSQTQNTTHATNRSHTAHTLQHTSRIHDRLEQLRPTNTRIKLPAHTHNNITRHYSIHKHTTLQIANTQKQNTNVKQRLHGFKNDRDILRHTPRQ